MSSALQSLPRPRHPSFSKPSHPFYQKGSSRAWLGAFEYRLQPSIDPEAMEESRFQDKTRFYIEEPGTFHKLVNNTIPNNQPALKQVMEAVGRV